MRVSAEIRFDSCARKQIRGRTSDRTKACGKTGKLVEGDNLPLKGLGLGGKVKIDSSSFLHLKGHRFFFSLSYHCFSSIFVILSES